MAKSGAQKKSVEPRGRRAGAAPAPTAGSHAGVAPALDQIIHERVRLGIVSALAVNESLTFIELRRLLDITDGNLSVHARRLEEAGYVTCEKSFEGRVPKTEFRLAPAGKRALERYLGHMEGLIRATRGA